jgi:hypothetical protein
MTIQAREAGWGLAQAQPIPKALGIFPALGGDSGDEAGQALAELR